MATKEDSSKGSNFEPMLVCMQIAQPIAQHVIVPFSELLRATLAEPKGAPLANRSGHCWVHHRGAHSVNRSGHHWVKHRGAHSVNRSGHRRVKHRVRIV
eukprot:366063-Chlamydomonas_euryale.AAC.1